MPGWNMPDSPEPPGWRIFVINPGSTSTKLSLYRGEGEVRASSIDHTSDELRSFPRVAEQVDLRTKAVERFVAECGAEAAGLDAVVGRGGLLRPLESGVYEVDDAMLAELADCRWGEHASNLGAPLAHRVASRAGCRAFIADPVVVDELEEVARLSGMPEIPRRSIFHALNQKSAAREVAGRLGKPYEECRFIVAHLGGGISVGAHSLGRVVDVNNALDGDGPFSPERSGGLPVGALVELATMGGGLSAQELRRKIVGGGGLVAYCGTNSLMRAQEAADRGDRAAALAIDAMAYQTAKEIAMHGATLQGRVDRIILTGGMAQDSRFVARIAERVSFLAPLEVVPGEREMLSLARNGLAVLAGTLTPRRYGAP
jgi:butyrate kinase